jgi:hypothetical protein
MPEEAPGVRDVLQALASLHAVVDTRMADMVEDIRVLRAYVIEGNGTPSLLARVTVIEERQSGHRDTVEALGDQLDGVTYKLDAINVELRAAAAERAERAQRDLERAKKERHDRIGWLVAAIGVGASLIQALAQYGSRGH